jgi:hypothetical protein
MPRIRIEITEDDGTRTTAEFEGENATRKAIRFIELSEEPISEVTYEKPVKSKIAPKIDSYIDKDDYSQDTLTLKERLYLFLKYEFPRTWFTSQEVKEGYEAAYGNINLSTVSTYLARLSREGHLEKRGNRIHRAYRVSEKDFLERQEIHA